MSADEHAERRADPDADRESASVAWFDESGAASTGSADPWFLGAWVVAAGALALGAGLFLTWILATEPLRLELEPTSGCNTRAGAIAPALVQGGLLGIVAMLVWTGVRRARTQSQRESVPGAEGAR